MLNYRSRNYLRWLGIFVIIPKGEDERWKKTQINDHGDKMQNFYYYLNAAYLNIVPNYSLLDFE